MRAIANRFGRPFQGKITPDFLLATFMREVDSWRNLDKTQTEVIESLLIAAYRAKKADLKEGTENASDL